MVKNIYIEFQKKINENVTELFEKIIAKLPHLMKDIILQIKEGQHNPKQINMKENRNLD